MSKKGGLGQFEDLRGAWQERGGVVFEEGWYPYAHYDQVSDIRYPLSVNSIKRKPVIPGIGIAFLKTVWGAEQNTFVICMYLSL